MNNCALNKSIADCCIYKCREVQIGLPLSKLQAKDIKPWSAFDASRVYYCANIDFTSACTHHTGKPLRLVLLSTRAKQCLCFGILSLHQQINTVVRVCANAITHLALMRVHIYFLLVQFNKSASRYICILCGAREQWQDFCRARATQA